MSWLSKYVFDPIKNAVHVNVSVAQSGPISQQIPNLSSLGVASPIIGQLETDLNTAVDAALIKLLGPVGTLAQPSTDAVLLFVEQHVNAYVAALFQAAHLTTAQAAPATA